MELAEFLNISRRRLSLLLIVPLAAAIIVGALLWNGAPQEYRAAATVAVPAQEVAFREVEQLISNFLAGTSTPFVLDQVSTETGEDALALQEGLQVRRVGESAYVEIVYSSTDPSAPVEVVRSVGETTWEFVFVPRLEAAEQQLTRAQQRRDEIESQLEELMEESDVTALSPLDLFTSRQAELQQLRTSQADARARGNTELFSELRTIIDEREKELARLRPVALAQRRLEAELEEAVSDAQTAEHGLLEAESRYGDSQDVGLVSTPRSSTPIARWPLIARRVAAAAGAGALLAVVVILLPPRARALTRRGTAIEGQGLRAGDDRVQAGSASGSTDRSATSSTVTTITSTEVAGGPSH